MIVLLHDSNITPFIDPWSTMTMIESNLSNVGRSMIKSMVMRENGWGVFSFDWLQWGICQVSVYLMLLAEGASLDVVLHESGQAWPPVILLNQFLCLELSWVSC